MNFWELSAFTGSHGVCRCTQQLRSCPCLTRMEFTMRGYPLRLPLTTCQVSDIVMLDEDILRAKGGRHVPDNSHEILEPEEKA